MRSSELERRWKAVRVRLDELGADAFLTIASDNILSGYGRWLTDASTTYRRAVVVYAQGLSTVVEHGPEEGVRSLSGDDPQYPGIGRVLTTPSIGAVRYTQAYEVELVLADLRTRGARRVVTANPDAMPLGFVRALQEASDIELIDDTDFLDRLKAVKSEAELEDIRSAARIQDDAYAAVLSQIAPGMHEFEVAALAEYEMARRQGRHGVVLVGSAPQGSRVVVSDPERQGRRLQPGDALLLLIEIASPSGYFLELGRTIVLGQAWPSLVKVFETARTAQAAVVDMLRPGRSARDVHAEYVGHMNGLGLEPDRRLFAHGQGYDMVERPLIRADEPMSLEAGMCLSCHPAITEGVDMGFLCDNVVLQSNGAPEWLHKTPKVLVEL